MEKTYLHLKLNCVCGVDVVVLNHNCIIADFSLSIVN